MLSLQKLLSSQVYLHPEDAGARILLKYLRQLWKKTLEKVVCAVKKIVDPTAFCLVVAAEATKMGKEVSRKYFLHLRLFYA